MSRASHLVSDSVIATIKLLQCVVNNKPVVQVSWLEALFANSESSPCPILPDPKDHSPGALYDLISSRCTLYGDLHVILVSRSGIHKDAYEDILMKCGAHLSKCYNDKTGIIDFSSLRDVINGSNGRNAVYFYINQPASRLSDTSEIYFLHKKLKDFKLKWFLSEHMINSILNNSPPELLNDPTEFIHHSLNMYEFSTTVKGRSPQRTSSSFFRTNEVKTLSELPICVVEIINNQTDYFLIFHSFFIQMPFNENDVHTIVDLTIIRE